MIGFLEGIVFDVTADSFVLNVNGVGYDISASAQTLTDVQVLLGQNMKVWIYTHVREDAFQLFGFLQKPEKEFFIQLLKVNGVGPKSALSVMSGAPVAQIQDWIESSDAKALSALPKVGKKTAEQIILTLQGKLVRVEAAIGSKAKANKLSETHRQISSALVNLGFKNQNVDQFVATLPLVVTIEEGVREGLKKLSGQIG
ncbi:Holliday junction branch migration protein RuvA [Pseudobdellovibrio exovorus]|uniref:Holliday junction branch migration complex subunit RuvA n=1 Tax=Pseudobdellovibrio exovorus JSS TaxID=1184267 RepID=M4V7J7_9BACT|nr:Holliday junction branch migration protein RuvA [Pseudobdellovibrio exovorus]AGH95183.1 Holliday junction DNA helicase RuvA [Pseudobdellovibrio exovorus JSS]